MLSLTVLSCSWRVALTRPSVQPPSQNSLMFIRPIREDRLLRFLPGSLAGRSQTDQLLQPSSQIPSIRSRLCAHLHARRRRWTVLGLWLWYQHGHTNYRALVDVVALIIFDQHGAETIAKTQRDRILSLSLVLPLPWRAWLVILGSLSFLLHIYRLEFWR